MSLPPGSVPRPPVLKPSLPPGWSCHVSKSVPGKCYYFNRFTGAKTWELGELLPGHSDNPTPTVPVAGSAQLPIVVHDQHHQPGHNQPASTPQQGGHQQPGVAGASLPCLHEQGHRRVHDQDPRHATSLSQPRPGHHLSQRMLPVTQGQHQPRRSKLAGPPLDLSTSPTGLGEEVTSLGVEELEAMLAEKRRNLEEMARKMSVDSSVDSSSVESGFVSLVGREEEGLLGRSASDRQKELTERGGLYRDWGQGDVGPSRPKRARVEFDNNSDKTGAVSVCEGGVNVTVEAVDNDNNNDEHANIGDVKDNNNNRDPDSLDEESLCGADPEELAALAKLDKKFPADLEPTNLKSEDPPSTTQSSSSPPELLLWDTDCQFSPEPSSEGEESEG